jgi:hypothetical protein
MQQLIIDYVLDGENRGYAFTTPTEHIAPQTLKTLWQQAMPRGQGWAADIYQNARSLKCIPLENGRIAVSEVLVTGQVDELGRQGLRRAEITLMTADEYSVYLAAQWERFPADIRKQAEAKFGFRLWKRIADSAIPKLKGNDQLVLTHPYTSAPEWQVVEAFVLKLVMAQRLRFLKGWGRLIGFTTLALDHREESPIVVLPTQALAQLKPGKDVSVIDIS